jgi:hypothetical protein
VTVLAQVSERNFPAQANDFPFSLPAGTERVTVTLDHPDWPDGECARIEVAWDGAPAIVMTLGGGPKVDVQGNTRAGNILCRWTVTVPSNVTGGVAHITVVQALRTAILVEAL